MSVQLKTQPNEARCTYTATEHVLTVPPCCPISANPREGSTVVICYEPNKFFLEVLTLREYIDSYQGGREDVRSMEGMIQQIATDCANCLNVAVTVKAALTLYPRQEEFLTCRALPRNHLIPDRKAP